MQEKKELEIEINAAELFLFFWRAKYLIIFFIITSIALASLSLRKKNYQYNVSMIVAQIETEEPVSRFQSSSIGGLASLAGISLPSGSVTNYKKFIVLLHSEEIASQILTNKKLVQELFGSEWDKNAEIYRSPGKSKLGKIKSYIKNLLTGKGERSYESPNPARLAKLMREIIKIKLDKKTGLLTISSETGNPELFKELMLSLIMVTDQAFKKNYIKNGSNSLKFYQKKISKARSKEHREILARLIAKEEQKQMLISSEQPFVAEILSGPTTSLDPTSPNIRQTLTFYLIFGILFASLIVFYQYLKSKKYF